MSVISEDIGLLLREKENVMRHMKDIAKQGLVLKKIAESDARTQVVADLSRQHKAQRKVLAELEARVAKTEGKIPRGTALMVASDQDTRSFDFYGVDALGYKHHRREAIEVGTRAMFRLTNFRFAVGTHMARDVLFLVPAASTAFLDFLEEAHQIAKDGVWSPGFFEGHNVLLAFRLYALVTRNPREVNSRAHLDVEGLLTAINGRRFCNVKFAMEISLLIPLFFALKRFPTILSMGAWECFFECLDTADDAKRLEEIATSAEPSKTSILVQERAVSERFEPFIDRRAVCGWSIKNSRDTAAALNAGREVEGGRATLRADPSQPMSLAVKPTKKHRTENPGAAREGTRDGYTMKVGDEEISIPQFGRRFQAVREKGLCRFCGHTGHGGHTAPELAASEAFRGAREEVAKARVAFVENEDADFKEATAKNPDPLLLLRAKHEGTPAHEKATRQAQLRYKAIDDSREALRQRDDEPSLWKQFQAERGEKADFNELLLNMGEARTEAKKFSTAVRQRYLLMLRNLNIKPSEESAAAAVKRVHWSVINTAADIEEAEELTAPKVILSQGECAELLSRPRTLAKATGAVRRAERFMFLLLWLLFVTGGRCENLWNAGPVRFLKDRVLVHWRRRKGGRHHPRCATPYLYSWTDLPPTPEILETIEIVKEITNNKQAIPWSSLTGDGGNLPAQKVTNWMAKLPANLAEREGDGKITSKCARDYFVNRLFRVAKEPGSRLDTNMYQLIADHTMTTALISYIDLNLHFPEEDSTWAQETLSKPGLFEENWLRDNPPSRRTQETPGATVADLQDEVKRLRCEQQDCKSAFAGQMAEVRKLLNVQEERIRRLENRRSATPTAMEKAATAAELREWEEGPLAASPRSRRESGSRSSPARKTARSSGRAVGGQHEVTISSSDDEDLFAFCADVNTSDEEGA